MSNSESRRKLVNVLYEIIDDELRDECLTRGDRMAMGNEAERVADDAIARLKASSRAIAVGLRKAKRRG